MTEPEQDPTRLGDVVEVARASMEAQPEIAPLTADVEKCRAAAAQFFAVALDGCETIAEKYRNVAHAYALVTELVNGIREEARRARHAAVAAEKPKKAARPAPRTEG